MKTTYRVLAWVIAALVVAQAASEAWFASGVGKFLREGGTLNLEDTSGPVPFVEIYGVIWHGMAGMYLIPVVSLVFLIVGFLSRNRRARTFSLVVAVLVFLQVTMGILASDMTILALFHGMNALLIFGTALAAALLVPRTTVDEAGRTRSETRRHFRRSTPFEEPRPTVGSSGV
ncbi:hypothetical protein [Corynebacterium guangdongense]|uniref:Heme A synthase n=1 Tax=Corynebacterium guangdongense TaxID=1783348 RepID=A0ABU1ZVE7_9CORY|nr:hypothetical protein [Corynebacterium guangdongense]MDR7328760.1 heme A synthase [Corynebacterium guangdongense]WJZ17336.1 hypothetical protein CGUA_03705 [Corynebacterium guangdongense]